MFPSSFFPPITCTISSVLLHPLPFLSLYMKWHQTPNKYFMTLLYPCANNGCYKNHKYISLHPGAVCEFLLEMYLQYIHAEELLCHQGHWLERFMYGTVQFSGIISSQGFNTEIHVFWFSLFLFLSFIVPDFTFTCSLTTPLLQTHTHTHSPSVLFLLSHPWLGGPKLPT